MALPDAPLLLAEIEAGVLVRSLVIALVIVIPYGLHKRRQVQARRQAEAPVVEGPPPSGPRLEDVVDAIPEAAVSAREHGSVTVVVPAGVTVDAKVAPPELVDALVRDALRRSGLVATAEVDTADGRSIECRPGPTSGAEHR